MTETSDRLRAIRERHRPVLSKPPDALRPREISNEICDECDQFWPCDAAWLLARVERLERVAKAARARQGRTKLRAQQALRAGHSIALNREFTALEAALRGLADDEEVADAEGSTWLP